METNPSNAREIATALRQLVSGYRKDLQRIDETTFSMKPNPAKWSKKEILGHLIDSAQNNLRRFITSQYEEHPPHIVYDQDYWVAANHYNDAAAEDLILLWTLLNDCIAAVLDKLTPEGMSRLCNTGKGTDELHPLGFLASDYVTHTRHHLQQIQK